MWARKARTKSRGCVSGSWPSDLFFFSNLDGLCCCCCCCCWCCCCCCCWIVVGGSSTSSILVLVALLVLVLVVLAAGACCASAACSCETRIPLRGESPFQRIVQSVLSTHAAPGTMPPARRKRRSQVWRYQTNWYRNYKTHICCLNDSASQFQLMSLPLEPCSHVGRMAKSFRSQEHPSNWEANWPRGFAKTLRLADCFLSGAASFSCLLHSPRYILLGSPWTA